MGFILVPEIERVQILQHLEHILESATQILVENFTVYFIQYIQNAQMFILESARQILVENIIFHTMYSKCSDVHT